MAPPQPPELATTDSALAVEDAEELKLVEQQSSPHEATRLRKLLSPRVSLLEALPPLQGPLGALCHGLQAAFGEQRARLPAGTPLGADMPAEAFARLDAAVRQLMGAYVASFTPGQPYDWQTDFFSSLAQCFNRFH